MEKQDFYQLKIYDDFGDLLLNAEVLARVLAGTASLSDCRNVEWRAAKIFEHLSALLHLWGGVLPTLDLDSVERLNFSFDLQDLQEGYRILMQWAGGLMTALSVIQVACVKRKAALSALPEQPLPPNP